MSIMIIFKYLGLAMEAAQQAADVQAKLAAVKAPDSPGGTEITDGEMGTLIAGLADNFSEICTRICQEANLPVKGIKVDITL